LGLQRWLYSNAGFAPTLAAQLAAQQESEAGQLSPTLNSRVWGQQQKKIFDRIQNSKQGVIPPPKTNQMSLITNINQPHPQPTKLRRIPGSKRRIKKFPGKDASQGEFPTRPEAFHKFLFSSGTLGDRIYAK
jgi:hypothetical protein